MNRYGLKVASFFNKIYILLFLKYYKIRNRGKQKVLIYTDSRGFDVSTYWGRKNPCYKSYIKEVIKEYNVDVFTCPHFSTTTLDFIYEYEKMNKDYDCIILHTGLVDYSIRPIDMINKMISDKRDAISLIKKITNSEINLSERNYKCLELYDGKRCSRFLDLNDYKVLNKYYINKIPNLIWIGINPVNSNWNGSYWKPRPRKLNENLILNDYLLSTCKNFISLADWSEKEVKENTVDNIHLSEVGFNRIDEILKEKLKKVLYDK